MKYHSFLAAFLAFLLLMTGCTIKENPVSQTSGAEAQTRTITAPDGSSVTVAAEPRRIVAATPAVTEILVEIGAAGRIAAIDNYGADVPGLPEDLPKIDFMNPDIEALVALEPDLLIASDIVSTGDKSDPFFQLTELGIPVVYLKDPVTLDAIEEQIVFVADLAGNREAGEALAGKMADELKALHSIGAGIPEDQKKTVYFEISPAPSLYTFGSGTFLNEIIELIGAKNIFADENSWIEASAEAVALKDPDVILTNVSYLDDPVAEILSRKGWAGVKAVQDGQVYLLPANPTSRPTHHVVEAAEAIARAVYPEYFHA